MRLKLFRLLIRLMAAVITFAIGFATFRLLSFPAVEESIQPVNVPALVFVGPQTQELIDLPPAKGSDLSIGIQVSQPNPNPQIYELRHIKLAKHGATIVELDLTEYVDNSEVTLNFRDSSGEYRILQRYRTSMSVSAEGPHLDLLDWRHFDSTWKSLESLGPSRFRSLPADQMQHTRFPRASKKDIIKEVRRRVGNDWPYLMELVQSCNGPNEGACYVGISSIYLRIQKQVRGRWVDVGLVEFRMAMGC